MRSSSQISMRACLLCILLIPVFILGAISGSNAGQNRSSSTDGISSLFTSRDACLVVSPDGIPLISIHAETDLVPASILKVFTCLAAFHYLGPDYRFPTEIYLDGNGDLYVKGYGDPLLITEVLADLAATIKKNLPDGRKSIRNIILDDSYFMSPLMIPGISDSTEPYDAPNGALCANFNSISFNTDRKGRYIGGEEQTPLFTEVTGRIKKSGLKEGRIPLSDSREEITDYVGFLLKHFLVETGVSITGEIKKGCVDASRSPLLFTFYSPFALTQAVSSLLNYSNNFMANQLLIASGAKAFGAPGTLEKGIRAAKMFASESLSLQDVEIVEGSGISRKNRISVRAMIEVVKAFTPYRTLMRNEGQTFYKTGTLQGVATRAGYLTGKDGRWYPFVVMLNSSNKQIQKVMTYLQKQF